MQPTRFLHKVLSRHCQNIHATRLKTICQAVEALLRGRKLSLTGLGRFLDGTAQVKNNIKRIDRLLGNRNVLLDRLEIYKSNIKMIIGNRREPIILVDWSSASIRRDFWILRASLPIYGRSLILYDEVHPEKLLDNQKITQRFLINLKEMLPPNCKPVIVTDAGFRNPWFKQVQKLGWDFVGRIRNKTQFKWVDDAKWWPCKALHSLAAYTPHFLGEVLLARNNPNRCYLFTVRQKPKNRIHRNVHGHRFMGSASRKHAKSAREPWVIATSLSSERKSSKAIIKIYKTRMQIECSFRDLKNQRNGFSLSEAQSKNQQRIEILLLIALLATLALWLIGAIGYQRKLQYSYQANTIRK